MRGAGGGRPSKPEAQRRNKNPRMKDTIRLHVDDRPAVVPDPAVEFTGVRADLWAAMWDRPVAMLWDAADVGPLTRMVVLQTTPEVYRSDRLLAEVRQLEDRFFLNPYSRVQQRITLVGDDGEEGVDGDVSWIDDARARLREPG